VDDYAETGNLSPRRKRKPRSPLEEHASWLLKLVAQEPDLTLAEIVHRLLAHRGVRTTDSSTDRFFKRHKVSYKKKESARGRAGSPRRGRGAAKLEGRPSTP
jgi:transposase